MDRLLVTGATGFIGEPTVKLLLQSKKFEIHTTHTSEKNFIDGCHCHVCDLLKGQGSDLIKQIQPSHILHLAWELPRDFEDHISNIRWLNVSLELLSEFKAVGGKRFVFAGSSSEYSKDRVFFGEDIQYSMKTPGSLYGACKKSITDIGIRLNDIQFCSARIFPVYGVEKRDFHGDGNTRLSAIVYAILNIINEKPAICKSPESIWDYVYINDVANCLMELVKSNITGIVNICSSKPYTMREVFTIIGHILNRPELVKFEENGISRYLVGDNSRLRTELGVFPKTELSQGLKIVIDEYVSMFGKK